MSASLAFELLEVGVRITGATEDLEYAGGFLDAYGPPTPAPREIGVHVDVRRDDAALDADDDGDDELWVHRSKHPYWDVRGARTRGAGVRWLNRPVLTSTSGDLTTVTTPRGAGSAMTGEAGWHVCRSLALYARDARAGKLLHASAAVADGRAILFVGEESSGKTTFMTEAVRRHGAQPLANDRVFLRLDGPAPIAASWPSYASFTEGTLLDHPPLAEAALAYERGETGHRTQTWGPTLRRAYGKDAKRVFPMTWLADALGSVFRRSAPLGGLVVGTLAPGLSSPTVERADLDDEATRTSLEALIASESFDAVEPSFVPWHGRRLPRGAPSARQLVSALRAAAVPVVRLDAPAPGFAPYLTRALAVLR